MGGWDGVARTTSDSPWVPAGLSLWELSVEAGSANKKADDDYAKRLTTPDESPTSSASYCALTARRWRDRRKWATDKAKDKRWQQVRAYGIDDLEAWLEAAPVTHAWVSELLGLKPYGMQTIDSWWGGWSTATDPVFSTELVLAGRSAEADGLRRLLSGPPQIITLRAGSLDEALAFVAAVALHDDERNAGGLLARTALVDDVGTWRVLADHPHPLILIARNSNVVAESRTAPGHHVIVPLTGRADADIELQPLDAASAAATLEAAGLEERRADSAGRLGRRSLLALRRHLATKPELHTPGWATAPVDRVARGVLMAGSWNDDAPGDQERLADLTGKAYDDLRDELDRLAAEQDPLVTRVDQTWTIVSPFDAWQQLRTHLRPDDLRRLQAAVEAVLLEDDPAFELDPGERWRASYEGNVRQHSSDLRAGLASTIALLGALGERVDAGRGATGVAIARALVRGLLASANDATDIRRWAALSSHLPLLAEGAPDAFLDGVRDGLTGDQPLLASIFGDDEKHDPMFSSSPHTGLLWALEVAAWSPEHFAQAVYLLARLADVDPGGRLMNRPANSLASIFCPWHPETTANNATRLDVLDELRKRYPSVAWTLMTALLPELHGVHHPTSGPTFRDWKPSKIVVTNLQWFEFVDALVERLISDAADDPERWRKLVDESNHVSPAARATIRDELRRRVDHGELQEAGREALWDGLRKMIAQHREHCDADWALPSEELTALEVIERKLAPQGAVESLSWLFEDHMPDLADARRKRKDGEYDHAGYTAALAERRREAIAKVADDEGWEGILRLAARAVVPWAPGDALAEASREKFETDVLSIPESNDGNQIELAMGYFSRRFIAGGWDWLDGLVGNGPLSATQLARLMLVTRDYPRSWERADELGPEVSNVYWSLFSPYGLGPEYPLVAETARRLLAADRPAGALRLIDLYAVGKQKPDAGVAVIAADALEALLEHQDSDPELKALRTHDFETLFGLLETHKAEVGPERVATLEWAYLPALGHEPKMPTLHEALARNPKFFVDVVSAIYRRRSDPPGNATCQQERVASNAWHLLSSWKRVPGIDDAGSVDGAALKAWSDAVMPLLDEADRRAVGEIQFGHVLAFAPADPDGSWPCVEVRDLLESLQSEKVEEGLRIQIFNNRGVTSRSPEDGGDQERAIAKKYREAVASFKNRWPRTASILRALADSYEDDARRYDAEAERRRKGLDP